MNALSRRLAKIEASLIKPVFVPKVVKLLAQPPDDAPDWRQTEFARELTEAKAECSLVVILVPVRPKQHMEIDTLTG